MVHILTGTSKGPQFEKVERLQTMKLGEGITYVGLLEGKYRVVQDESR